MEQADYDQWSERYAATFGMTSDADAAMFAAWFEVFTACGYTLAELAAARMAIARRPPTYRSEHLAAIHAAVRDARLTESRKRAADPLPGDRGACSLCGDSGMVTVPHPQQITQGRWQGAALGYRATAAVACSCHAGQAVLAVYDGRSPEFKSRIARPMALAEYQRIAPRWKTLLAGRDADNLAGSRADDAAKRADKAAPLAKSVRAVIGRIGDGRRRVS